MNEWYWGGGECRSSFSKSWLSASHGLGTGGRGKEGCGDGWEEGTAPCAALKTWIVSGWPGPGPYVGDMVLVGCWLFHLQTPAKEATAAPSGPARCLPGQRPVSGLSTVAPYVPREIRRNEPATLMDGLSCWSHQAAAPFTASVLLCISGRVKVRIPAWGS